MKKWNTINFYENLILLILSITALSMGIYLIEREIFYYDGIGMNPYVTLINIIVVLIVVGLTIRIIINKYDKRKSL